MVVLGIAVLVAAIFVVARRDGDVSRADPGDAKQVAFGRKIYDAECASCHGASLEGQPNWRDRLPSGRLPAPPHDASGHTWHHPDAVLFGVTKEGLTGSRYAPPGYASDMPAFGAKLSDDAIWAVIAFIKSTWPSEVLARQREVDRAARAREGQASR